MKHVSESIKPSLEDVLEHYGVKGMRWGVRRSDQELSGSRGSKKAGAKVSKSQYVKALSQPKLSEAQKKKNYAKAQKQHRAKSNPSQLPEDENERWRPTRKQVLIGGATVAIGAAVAATIIANNGKLKMGDAIPEADYLKKLKSDTKRGFDFDPGQKLSHAEYNQLVSDSTDRVWGSGSYLTKESFKNSGLSLDAGHTFYRVSNAKEEGFKPSTFCVSGTEELSRYLGGGTMVGTATDQYVLSFKAKSPIRIPSTYQAVEAMREVLEAETGSRVKPSQVLKAYSELSGKPIYDDNPRATGLMKTLKAKGFSGIIDEMDAGITSEAPLLIFGDDFTEKVPTRLTSEAFEEAMGNITEIKHRKHGIRNG